MEYVVYFIVCLKNNKVYVGRSQEYEKRWRAHKNMLRSNTHRNMWLQEDWNKYGEENFDFRIIHTVHTVDDSIKMEQCYIDDHTLNKYNISSAESGGDTYTNNPRSPETSKLKSKVFSGKGNPMYGRPKTKRMIENVKKANSKPVSIEGVEYKSSAEASKFLGIGETTVNYRINATSNKFKEWKYI